MFNQTYKIALLLLADVPQERVLVDIQSYKLQFAGKLQSCCQRLKSSLALNARTSNLMSAVHLGAGHTFRSCICCKS